MQVAINGLHIYSHHTKSTGEGMTCSNSTPEIGNISTHAFALVEKKILADRSLTPTDKLIYGVIKSHRNRKSGTAWPSRQLISRIADCTENHVTKSTRRLVEAGYLLKDQRPGRATVFRFPLADQVATTPIQTDWGERPTPIRLDWHNRQRFSEQTKKPQQQQPAVENPGGSVVVVPEPIASKPTITIEIQPPPFLDTLNEDNQADETANDPATAEIPVIQDSHLDIVTLEVSVDPDSCLTKISDATHQEVSVPADVDDPLQSLTFPGFISLLVKAQIIKALCGVPLQDAQSLLDELTGARQKTPIQNPVGYLRRLLSLYREGTLIFEHAPRISEDRRRQRENEANLKRAAQRRLDSGGSGCSSSGPPNPPRSREAALAAIAQIRMNLGSSVRQPPS